MRALQTDLSIYKKFNFERPPVGIKYFFHKPEGIEQLDKELAFCEMLKEAHERNKPFYFAKENEDCSGKAALGMMDETAPFAASGEMGTRLGIFQEPRANARLFRHNLGLGKGTVNYVAYAPFDQLTFDPDLLVIVATPRQAEIVLRAMTYSTGVLYESKTANVLACSWLYVYPYLSAKVNYVVTGLEFGMEGRKVFPEGLIIISIPHDWIPTITRNLNEMTWDIEAYTLGREKFIQWEHGIMEGMAKELKNH